MRPRSKLTITTVAALATALLALPGAAAARDANHDRIPDRWEKRHNLSLQVKQTHRDQDRDRLFNRAEFLAGNNPHDSDSDGDGIADGEENAGTIQSFDAETGRLTIALFGGDTISGLVDEQTKIKCEDEHSPDIAAQAQSSHDESEDDSGGDDSEDNSGHGSSHSGQGPSGHDDEGTGANCTTSDLIPGATVEEAELELANGLATFEEVELAE
jgi:hypothetical protein